MDNDQKELNHKEQQAMNTMKSRKRNSRSSKKRSSLTSALFILTAIFYDPSFIPSTNASTSPRRSTLPFTSKNDLALKHRSNSNSNQRQYSQRNQNYNRSQSNTILQSNKRHKGLQRDVLFDDEMSSSFSTPTSKRKVRNSQKTRQIIQDGFENSNSNHFQTSNHSNDDYYKSKSTASSYDYDYTKSQQRSNTHYNNAFHGITSTQSKTPSTSTSTSTSLLQVPLSLTLQQQQKPTSSLSQNNNNNNRTPIKTFLDTGAQVTIITFETAKKSGIAHLIDTRYAGHACGVAGVSCRVLGRIPARTVSFCFQNENGEVVVLDKTPAITVLEGNILGGSSGGGRNKGVDMLLGLDVLEEWKATLCLYDRTLKLRDGMISGVSDMEDGDSVIIPLSCHRKNDDEHDHTSFSSSSSSSYALEDDYGLQESKRQQSIGNDYYSMDDDLDQDDTYSTSTSSSSLLKKSLRTSTISKNDNEYDEEEEYLDDNYYFVDSEDEFDECDLSGV